MTAAVATGAFRSATTTALKTAGSAAVGAAKAEASNTVASIGDYISTAVDEAAQLDKRIREIGVLTGKVADDDIKNMKQELELLSVSSGQSIELLTDAKYDIVKSGFTDASDSALLLSHSASLAVAGVTEVTTAADLLTNVLSVYRREASSAGEVTDDLFTIAQNSSLKIDELRAHLASPIAAAAQNGVEFDEVGAAMSTLTSQGQAPEHASTAITATISELSNPSEEMIAALKKVGVESNNLIATTGGLKGGLDLVKSASESAGVSIRELIHDENALLAVTSLTSSASESFSQDLLSMSDNAGATDAAVSKIAESSGLLMDQIGQAFESTQRAFGGLVEGNEDYKQFLIDVRDLVGQFAQQLHEGNPVFDAFVSILSKMGSFLVGMARGGISLAIEGLRGLVATVGRVERNIRVIIGVNKMVAGSLSLVGGLALQAGGYLIEGFSNAIMPLKLIAKGIDLIGNGLARIRKGKWDSIEEKIALLQDGISSYAGGVNSIGQAAFKQGQKLIGDGITELSNIGDVKERYDELDKALLGFRKALADSSHSLKENKERNERELSNKVVTADGKLMGLKDRVEDEAVNNPKTLGTHIKEIGGLENESAKLKGGIDDLGSSVGNNLNPKVKGLTKSVEHLGEVAGKVSQQAVDNTQSVLQEEKKPLSVADSEKKNSGEAEDDEVKLTDVFKQVAGGLSTLGYDLKGVGNFEKAINKIQEASKLGKDGKTDSTEAYIEGIGNLMMGVGANIGGDFGNALSSTASMALTGLEIAGGNPIGAVIGGAVGLISSIFGGDDEEERKEAEREKIRQQIYQGMLSRSLSGSGPYSLKMLRESNWDYDKLKKQFGNKDEEELIKYQNRLELLDDIGASLEQIGSPEIVRSIDQVRAKYEYAAKSVKGMLDIASAEMTEISAQVFGLTADNLVSMFDSAIETAEDASHAGRLIAEALELQIVDSFKKLAISQAINEAVMPMLQPILNELVAGALSGGLSPGEMADLVLQAQEIAASVAPAVSSLYGAFDEAGVLNYSYSSPPFESQGSYNGPVITGGTGVASGQQNDTRGDRPVQVVVQVANHEFETMVTELADNVFVRAERRKGVVNAQKVFG